MRGVIFTLLLAALSLVFGSEPVSLSFQVEPQQEECFYENVNVGTEVDARIMIYRGGKLDIKMRIESPSNEVIYDRLVISNVDDQSGELLSTIVKKGANFIAQKTGVYAFCFDNRAAKWTAKVLTLDLELRDPNGAEAAEDKEVRAIRDAKNLAGGDIDPKTSLTLMRAACHRIHSKLALLENDQLFHYHREKRHRATIESTNSRVVTWSLVETVVLVGVAILQVFLVRTWFRKPHMSVV